MAARRVQVGRVDVEAHMPAASAPANGGEQDLGVRCADRLSSVGVIALNEAQEPPQPAGVVVHPDRADSRQCHRPGITVTDPNAIVVVAEPEGFAAPALLLSPGEPDLAAPTLAGPRVLVGGERAAEVAGGFLEYLRGDLAPPGE